MGLLLEILNKILLNESVSIDSVTDAIKNRYEVVINYIGDKKHGIAPGIRVIQTYVYGLTKAGNPVIRAYQPYGDTASTVPSWKFFRLDRIQSWKKTYSLFNKPAPLFNPNGDNSMSIVFDIVKFNNNNKKEKRQTPKVVGKIDNIDQILKDRNVQKPKKYQAQINNIGNKEIKEPEITGTTNITKIEEPKVSGVDDNNAQIKNDNTFKTSGDNEIEKIKDLNRRLDNVRKIDLSKFSK